MMYIECYNQSIYCVLSSWTYWYHIYIYSLLIWGIMSKCLQIKRQLFRSDGWG